MEKPAKIAIVCSAFMAPGAGQFVQRRWVAGAFYLTAFLVCAVFMLVELFRPVIRNIQISIDFASHRSDLPFVYLRMGPFLVWLGLTLAVYFTSLLDTWAAYARECSEWARQHSRLRAVPMPPDGKP